MMVAGETEQVEPGEGERRKPATGAAVPVGTPKDGYPQRMDCATAAQFVGVSSSTLRKATAKGLLPMGAVIRHGSRVTYDKDALLRWHTDGNKAA
jgi:hypothetical protein